MDDLEEKKLYKQRELAALKKITALTDEMRKQLDGLSEQVDQIHSNAGSVANVMANWDSIRKYISEASLGLLQYAEGDYEVGMWEGNKKKTAEDEDKKSDEESNVEPLPEALVRISVNNKSENTTSN